MIIFYSDIASIELETINSIERMNSKYHLKKNYYTLFKIKP